MKYINLILVLFLFASCGHTPKCGNLAGAKTIVYGQNSCVVRIRQVMIANELKIPQSLKDSGLMQFQLDWVEGHLNDGRIEMGHFVLVPIDESGKQ